MRRPPAGCDLFAAASNGHPWRAHISMSAKSRWFGAERTRARDVLVRVTCSCAWCTCARDVLVRMTYSCAWRTRTHDVLMCVTYTRTPYFCWLKPIWIILWSICTSYLSIRRSQEDSIKCKRHKRSWWTCNWDFYLHTWSRLILWIIESAEMQLWRC